MPNAIAVTLRANYLPILHLFLQSLERSNPGHPDVIVCQKGFSPAQVEFLQSNYPRLRCIDLTAYRFLKGPAMLNRQNYDVDPFYARFLIWTDLFDAYDNVLYLDVDAFVTGPLDELFSSGKFLCFEESYHGPHPLFYDAADPALQQLLHEDGLTMPETSGNAGALLIPRRYRTPEQLATLYRLLQRYEKFLVWGDQTLINLWMAGNGIRPIKDYRFNFQVRLLRQRREAEAYRDVRFFHMNGWNHLDCTEALIRIAFVFFFLLPGGRRIFPYFIRLTVRGEMPRLARGYRTVVRGAEVLFRRLRWLKLFPSPRLS